MLPQERFERILKDLDRLSQAVDSGAKALGDLDAKVEAYRLKQKIDRMRRELRVEAFAVEDATGMIGHGYRTESAGAA